MPVDTSVLKNWIRDHPEKAPSAKIVAVYHGLNVDYARRESQRKEGVTLGKFVSDVRLARVQELLLTTQKSCFEIAFDLHMREDVLSRWFKQRTQMTMEEFRRKNGQPINRRAGGGGGPKRR